MYICAYICNCKPKEDLILGLNRGITLIIVNNKIMNVTEISKHTVHYLETDTKDCNFFTRYSADIWSVRMGESDNSVYDNETIAELEVAFQKWVSENQS